MLQNCDETDKAQCSDQKKIESGDSSIKKIKVPLSGTSETLDEIGETLQEFENKGNLISIYQDIYQSLKPTQRRGFLQPEALRRLNVSKIQMMFQNKVYPMLESINDGVQSQTSTNNLEKTCLTIYVMRRLEQNR